MQGLKLGLSRWTCADPEKRVYGGPDSPSGKSKCYVSLKILVQITWKIRKLPRQHSMLGHHQPTSKTPFKFPNPAEPYLHFQEVADTVVKNKLIKMQIKVDNRHLVQRERERERRD